MAIDLTRRRTTRALLGGLLFALIEPNRVAAAFARYGDDGLTDAINEMFKDRQSARIVGSEFLEEYPSERDLDALLHKIRRVCYQNGKPGLCWTDVLSAQIRRDFEAGSVFYLDGWVLSTTEARLCGVVACS